MIKSVPFANAATAVTAAFYIICALLSYVMPDLLIYIANSWIHSFSLEALKATQPISFGYLILGLVTISAITWVTTYVWIELYNRWVKK